MRSGNRLSENHLHIVAFDVPAPPDYGGVIDVYYKVKALHKLGVKIHLHCFDYGRGPKAELKKYCHKVWYYRRKTRKTLLLHKLPFIVVSRSHRGLLQRLLQDQHPILFEGLHSCFFLDDPKLAHRIKLVRNHNVEHEYYLALARAEQNAFKKAYFSRETMKLKAFEPVLRHAQLLLAISPNDTRHFSRRYGNTEYLPAFHPEFSGQFNPNKERVALYHGNLGVAENDKAARFLVSEVFAHSPFPLVIAGNNASVELIRLVNECDNVTLLQDVNTEDIREWVQRAWINLLPTFQGTGIKLKLLFALYNGGYCMVNSTMVKDTGLEEYCVVKDSAEEIIGSMEALMRLPFGEEEFAARIRGLQETFCNETNAARLLDWINQLKEQ